MSIKRIFKINKMTGRYSYPTKWYLIKCLAEIYDGIVNLILLPFGYYTYMAAHIYAKIIRMM